MERRTVEVAWAFVKATRFCVMNEHRCCRVLSRLAAIINHQLLRLAASRHGTAKLSIIQQSDDD